MTPRRVGERFTDPEYGELLVVDRGGCDRCIYFSEHNSNHQLACHAPERPELTGSCLPQERPDKTSVIFAKLKDYAAFKLTGEWP